MADPADPTSLQRRADRALQLLRPLGIDNVRAALDDTKKLSRVALDGLQPGSVAPNKPVQTALEAGRSAIDNLDLEGAPQDLTPDLVAGLEAVVVAVGRPAILIRSGHFDPPPAPWSSLEPKRASIEALFPSTGRIDVAGHPTLDWVGTGFLVAPGVLATARHVVQEFATPDAAGKWRIDGGMSVKVDFAEEIDTTAPREHQIRSVIAVHRQLDVALLEVDDTAGADAVAPMRMDGGGVPLAPGRNSYVIGFPALDSRRNDPAIMQQIFAGIYNVKRLQPGLLTDWSNQMNAYLHDCATLGGNSGSCLVDLETGVVVGVHFGGRFAENNWAVSTRDMASDGYLQSLGAVFV
ncbi:MAG: trypsin-like serine peptidase [Phenylobacterium sp.]